MSRLIDADELVETLAVQIKANESDASASGVAAKEVLKGFIGLVNGQPTAQPEIIRCTECKHYREYDSEYVENAVVVQCMADRYPISEIIPDGWFCAGAERKDNG